MIKQKKRTIEVGKPGKPEDKVSIEIPDEAVNFIVQRYLSQRSVEGLPIVRGISTDDVEAVLGMFLEWAASRNYIKDGILILGGSPIG